MIFGRHSDWPYIAFPDGNSNQYCAIKLQPPPNAGSNIKTIVVDDQFL